jgi:MoxR-like ATPase
LRATLTAQGKAALQGMPGVGKTQLALKYAERHRQGLCRRLVGVRRLA